MNDKEKLLAQLQEYYNQIEQLRNRKGLGSKVRRNYNDVLKDLLNSINDIDIIIE